MNLDIFEAKTNTSIIQKYGKASPEELMKPPPMTSPRNQSQQYRSTSEKLTKQLDDFRLAQINRKLPELRTLLKNAEARATDLSDKSSYIREVR